MNYYFNTDNAWIEHFVVKYENEDLFHEIPLKVNFIVKIHEILTNFNFKRLKVWKKTENLYGWK